MRTGALILGVLAVGAAGADARPPVDTGVIAGAPSGGRVPVLLSHGRFRKLSARGLPRSVRPGDRIRYSGGRLKIVRRAGVPSFLALADLLATARRDAGSARDALAATTVPAGPITPAQVPALAAGLAASRTQVNLLREDLDRLATALESARAGVAAQAERLRRTSRPAAAELDRLATTLASAGEASRSAGDSLAPVVTKLDEALLLVNGTPPDALGAALSQFNLPVGVGDATRAVQIVFQTLNALSLPPATP